MKHLYIYFNRNTVALMLFPLKSQSENQNDGLVVDKKGKNPSISRV